MRNRRGGGLTSSFKSVLSLILGGIAAWAGLSMTAPSVWSSQFFSYPGIFSSELPWLQILFGVAAIALADRRAGTRRIGGWLGFVGLVLGFRPLWQLAGTIRRNKAAMRDALGADYESRLPPHLLRQTTRGPLDFTGSLRQRRAASERVQITRDVLFHSLSDQALYADLYEPIPQSNIDHALRPAVIVIHGGSWRSGDKGGFYATHCRWLAQQGYVVLDVQYRLSPDHVWPTHLADVKTAIRWLRSNAERYAIDPERIGLLGRSAGAHLALMAAFTAGDPAFPPVDGLAARDDVQAVVAIYPPTDLFLLQETVYGSLSYWLGSRIEDRPDIYLSASPLYAVKEGAPPVLLAHGGFDNLVIPEHSERLHKRLGELGIPSVLLRYPWGRHGFDFSLIGLGGQMVQYDTDRFLAATLGNL